MNIVLCTHSLHATRKLVAGVVLLLGGSAGLQGADSWTRFRGPNGDGVVASTTTLPLQWTKEEGLAFRTPIPGQGWSSPVVSDGRIYLSAAIATNNETDPKKANYDLSLLILDSQSGSLIKTVSLIDQKGGKNSKIHKKNSHASPTPIIDGDRVYVHFGYQGTVCTDREGEVIWKNRDLFFKPVHGNGGTPILVDQHLIFTCDGASDPKVVALRADDGKVAWEVKRPVETKKKFSFCTPTLISVAGRKQVIAPGSDCVLALNPINGEIIWQLNYTGYSVIPKPVFHQGTVFLSTSYDSPSMIAIDPTGQGDVTKTHLRWTVEKNVPHTPSMIARDGLIHSVSDNGIAMCVDAETGDVIYKKRIGGSFSASPLLVKDRIYFTDEAGMTTVVQAGREFNVLAENDLGERTLASAAVDGNALIMRTADAVYRIEN
jgi:outer membrane protein assembly factor BamB